MKIDKVAGIEARGFILGRARLRFYWKALGVGEYIDFRTFAALLVVRTDSVTGDNNEIKKDTTQLLSSCRQWQASAMAAAQPGD